MPLRSPDPDPLGSPSALLAAVTPPLHVASPTHTASGGSPAFHSLHSESPVFLYAAGRLSAVPSLSSQKVTALTTRTAVLCAKRNRVPETRPFP